MTYITKQQVVETLIRVCNDNPNKINPVGVNPDTGDKVCVYNDGNNRCLAGEVIFLTTGENIAQGMFTSVLGLHLAASDPAIRSTTAEFGAASVQLLQQAQIIADGRPLIMDGNDAPEPRPWSEVLAQLEHDEVLNY